MPDLYFPRLKPLLKVSLFSGREGRPALPPEDLLARVNRGRGVVIVPIEPKVLEIRHSLKAFALRRSGGGTALEIPAAAGGGIHQGNVLAIGRAGAEEFRGGGLRRYAADEGANRFAIGPGENQ